MCVRLTVKVLLGNTPQYHSQMKSDFPENFREWKYWSPELIKIVHGHARAHARLVQTKNLSFN